MHKIKNDPISNDDAVNKQYVDDEIRKINAKLNLSLEKTIVCVVDDDGTTRTSDAYTGMTTWLNDKGIPMNFAICHDTIGTSGKYTVTELQELQAKGNDILIHGNPKLTTLANETEVIAEIEKALQFHTSNDLKPTNIYVYPQGLNSDGNLTATQVKEIVGRYFDYGLNVNIASMSGEDTKGLWNKVPLVDKLNIARMEVSSTKGFDANKSKIDACIENKGLLILFTHSFMSQFTSGGYDEFKKIINYLLTKDVEFLTVSNALDKVEKIIKNYDDTQVKADIAKNKKDIADLDTNKQDKTDNTLDTTDKTVVGAINEINSSLLDNATDLTNHTSNTDVHITTAERTLWNTVSNKADVSQIHTHSNKTVLDKITEANVKTMNDVASGIGGRNLFTGTSVEKIININTPTNYTTFDPYTTFNKSTLSDLGYSVGDELTVSFEWEISKNGSLSEVYGSFKLEWTGFNSDGSQYGLYLGDIGSVYTLSSSNKKGKVSLTTKITSNDMLKACAIRIRVDKSVINFKVSKMKLEKGNIATDWTPAPEDMPINSVTTIDSTSTNSQVPTAKSVYNLAGNENRRGYVYNNPTYRGDKWNRVFRVNSLLSCDSGFLTVTVYSNSLCQIATFLMSKNFNRLNIKQINCGGYNGDNGQTRPIKVRIVSAETIGYSFLEIYVSGTSNTNVVATYMPLSCNSVVVLNEEGSIPSGMFACEMTATHDTYENAAYTSILK